MRLRSWSAPRLSRLLFRRVAVLDDLRGETALPASAPGPVPGQLRPALFLRRLDRRQECGVALGEVGGEIFLSHDAVGTLDLRHVLLLRRAVGVLLRRIALLNFRQVGDEFEHVHRALTPAFSFADGVKALAALLTLDLHLVLVVLSLQGDR